MRDTSIAAVLSIKQRVLVSTSLNLQKPRNLLKTQYHFLQLNGPATQTLATIKTKRTMEASCSGQHPLASFDSKDEDSLAHLAPVNINNRACGSRLHGSRCRGPHLRALSYLLSGPSSAPTLSSKRVNPSISLLGRRQKLGSWGQFTETDEGRTSSFCNSSQAVYKMKQQSERCMHLYFTSSLYLLPPFVPKR